MTINLRFPSTFQIAIFLSLLVFLLAIVMTKPSHANIAVYSFEVLHFWKDGFWELLEFTMQMVLILVFGHTLAMSKPVNGFLDKITGSITSNTYAVLVTASLSMLAGYLNWGFGLIIGAILARKIGEEASKGRMQINYPLVAASGYLGMAVWHGGLSGSATLKAAEPSHFLLDQIGVITVDRTIFSGFNLGINTILFVTFLLVLYFLSKRGFAKQLYPQPTQREESKLENNKDKLGYVIGGLIVFLGLSEFWNISDQGWGFLDLNFVNFVLLGLGLLAFGSLDQYVSHLSKAVKGATDILIQFPFYAGILGIMKYSGLLVMLADDMVSRSGPDTFPLLTFFSAAIINFFVPSGGGQWAVQGPVVMEAAVQMGIDVPKMILVFAYGDQVSNLLQPFWALPLLSITGLPAKEILRYTGLLFLVASLIFAVFIWFAVS
ncbi:short-chain fatty acid transporter [Arthrospiribacter ruber]|uniref:Short-chain fatty acid transporter n=1 Tax=Arthrospiribacter ruber TaxID=2487934 RepID=A0A951IRR9_9BACT|nr:TIGR00366 family protein [Arthrospiribacter ruber]MBW3466513.1 short-chain fatty acid transporter [Arthrospiribacter ruber]